MTKNPPLFSPLKNTKISLKIQKCLNATPLPPKNTKMPLTNTNMPLNNTKATHQNQKIYVLVGNFSLF